MDATARPTDRAFRTIGVGKEHAAEAAARVVRLAPAVSVSARLYCPGPVNFLDAITFFSHRLNLMRARPTCPSRPKSTPIPTELQPILSRGDGRSERASILEIEVQGAFQLRRKAPTALFVFVDVPGLDVLEERIRARGTEDEATIQRRLLNARRERDHSNRL